MAYKRADRVNSLLQRELGTLISEELRDPRIAFPTVTAVEITPDLRSAKVHVSVLGDEEAAGKTMKALEDAKPFLRRELGSRTQLRFLHGTERFTQDPPPEDVDLVVTVDFGSVDRAKFALPAGPTLVNIDHHASNDHFGTANLVDVTAAASAELVSRVIDELGIKWTPEMATAALVGIMTDTGSFQFPSTDARALDRAARLREAGAELQAITYNIFRNKRFEALKLW